MHTCGLRTDGTVDGATHSLILDADWDYTVKEGKIVGATYVGVSELSLEYTMNRVYNSDTNKIVEVHSFKTGKYFPTIKTEY